MAFCGNYLSKDIPNITTMISDEEVRNYHHKIVRFDCIVSDMFEEEYFVSVLQGGPAELKPVVYKYYSSVSDSHTELLH